ncbi:MAG: LysM peptidoglycan-binding domain-containing protein [Verrucomicrobiota bacterium]
MKSTLLLVAISWVVGAFPLIAKSEMETLRSLCAEQERQIRQLEDENAKLRSSNGLTASRTSNDKASHPAQPVATPAATPATATSPAKSKTYTALANDSLARVSRKFDITPAALAGMNGLKATSTIHAGQKLKVPGVGAPAPTEAAPAPPTASAAAVNGKTHQLKDGETFSSIGKKYGIPTATLIAANPDVKPTAMRPGRIINLAMPAQSAAATPKPTPQDEAADTPAKSASRMPNPALKTQPTADKATPRAEKSATLPVVAQKPPIPPTQAAKPPVAATTAATPGPTKKSADPLPATAAAEKPSLRSVTIDGTTTFGEFAAKHGTSISRLNDLNALELVDSTVLARGSELYVPAQP